MPLFAIDQKCQYNTFDVTKLDGVPVVFSARDEVSRCVVVAHGDGVFEYAFFGELDTCICHCVVTHDRHPEASAYAKFLALSQMWYDNCDSAQQDRELIIGTVR
jgi:choline kinase